MKLLYLLLITVLFYSCGSNQEEGAIVELSQRCRVINDSIFSTYSKGKEISSVTFSKIPERVVLLATPLYSYVRAISMEKNIVGMLSVDRVANALSSIKNVGTNSEIDLEKVISLNPDLIICNSYQLKNLVRIRSEIQVLVVDEYSENSALKKASWVSFFGALFQQGAKGDALYLDILSKYQPFDPVEKKVIQLNNFGGKWYLPGAGSYISKVIKDAGGQIVFESEKSGSDIISEETAFVRVNELDYLLFFDWKEDTIGLRNRLRPVLNLLKKKDLKLLYCNTVQTNFFDESVLQPEIVISDLNRLIKSEKDGKFFKLITLEK